MSDYVSLDDFREWLEQLPADKAVGDSSACPLEVYARMNGLGRLGVGRHTWRKGDDLLPMPQWATRFTAVLDDVATRRPAKGWERITAGMAREVLEHVAPHHPIQEPGKGDTAPMK